MTEKIESLLREEVRFEPQAPFVAQALVREPEDLYRRSVDDLEGYWGEVARGFR